ncbi:MAG TPA: hypothetical protein VNI84_02065 [Pyrinomonadaceae bacterium]|nr:hypothetical protein [Pyrinomonadaceae bacterium]
MKNYTRKIKNTGLVLSVALGLLVFSGVTANAQYRDDDDRRERREDRRERRQERREDREELRGTYNSYGNNVFRQAQENGYREGLFAGQDDARSGRYRNPQSINQFKKGTSGYSNRYGNKNAYRDAYRRAFLQGYSQGQRGSNNRRRGY